MIEDRKNKKKLDGSKGDNSFGAFFISHPFALIYRGLKKKGGEKMKERTRELLGVKMITRPLPQGLDEIIPVEGMGEILYKSYDPFPENGGRSSYWLVVYRVIFREWVQISPGVWKTRAWAVAHYSPPSGECEDFLVEVDEEGGEWKIKEVE